MLCMLGLVEGVSGPFFVSRPSSPCAAGRRGTGLGCPTGRREDPRNSQPAEAPVYNGGGGY